MLIKETLRAEYIAKTAALSPEYRVVSSGKITDVLRASGFYRRAATIFCFIGVASEVGTLPLIGQAIKDGKRVCVPRTLGGGVMEARVVTSTGDLKQQNSGFGLIEPKKACPLVQPEEIDLILVPCLSVDPYGNRLGYGGGYYDRYLKQISKDAITIALCRDELLAMTLPSGSNDVKMQHCATESGLKQRYNGFL